MSDIPTQAFHEILRRLPTAALPQFRRVCKLWRHIIDNYLRLQIETNHLIFKNGIKLYSVPLTSLCFSDAQTTEIEATIVKKIIRGGIQIVRSFPISSCHGIILLWLYKVEKDWAIWNPFTNDYRKLPRFDHIMSNPRGYMARGGLGYDRVTDDYKVVRVSQIDGCGDFRCPRGLETLIYSLKLDEWHRIADFPNCLVQEGLEFGVFANGAIHWNMWLTPGEGAAVECIMALDLCSESYRQLPMPVVEEGMYHDRLDCLNERLVLSYNYAEKFDVWMMEDYGGESAWMKFISLENVENAFNISSYLVHLKVVAYVESTQHVLIRNNWGKFLWFDVVNKRGKMININGIDSAQVLQVSHVRLPGNDGAVESAPSQGTLKRKRKSTKDRLRLRLTTTDVCLSPEPRYLSDSSFASETSLEGERSA